MNASTFRASAWLLSAALSFVAPHTLWAAAISIDDTAPDETVTLSVNDFEGGLFVNGALFQQGLGNPSTATFPETGPLNFSGTWVTANQQSPFSATYYLVETPYDPASPITPLISDILQISIDPVTANGTAVITGSFVSDTADNLGFLPQGTDPAFVFLEAGNPLNLGFAFLSIRVISDAEIPEPSSVCLAALGLAGLAMVGYRRRKRSTN